MIALHVWKEICCQFFQKCAVIFFRRAVNVFQFLSETCSKFFPTCSRSRAASFFRHMWWIWLLPKCDEKRWDRVCPLRHGSFLLLSDRRAWTGMHYCFISWWDKALDISELDNWNISCEVTSEFSDIFISVSFQWRSRIVVWSLAAKRKKPNANVTRF